MNFFGIVLAARIEGVTSLKLFIPGMGERKMNSLKRYREDLLLSKAELAKKAGISPLTIDRVENGKKCRLSTKRKIILALGLKLSDRKKIFAEERLNTQDYPGIAEIGERAGIRRSKGEEG